MVARVVGEHVVCGLPLVFRGKITEQQAKGREVEEAAGPERADEAERDVLRVDHGEKQEFLGQVEEAPETGYEV